MDPLHASLALGPVAIYFLLLGLMNLSSTPIVTSGMRDTAALGIAMLGFAIVGPMELFMPDWAPGWLAWPLMIAFYVLSLTLLVLLMRPRIVIYNVTPEQLRQVLADTISRLDKEARVAGESVFLPGLGVQLHIEPLPVLKNVQLKASGPLQSYSGWSELEIALRQALRDRRGGANPYGITLLGFGLVIVLLISYWMIYSGTEIRDRFSEMLRIPGG